MSFCPTKKNPTGIVLEPDVLAASEAEIPNLKYDLAYARSILQTCSQGSGDCV